MIKDGTESGIKIKHPNATEKAKGNKAKFNMKMAINDTNISNLAQIHQ